MSVIRLDEDFLDRPGNLTADNLNIIRKFQAETNDPTDDAFVVLSVSNICFEPGYIH